MVPFDFEIIIIKPKVCKILYNLGNVKISCSIPGFPIFFRRQRFLLYKFDCLIFVIECFDKFSHFRPFICYFISGDDDGRNYDHVFG